MEESKLTRSFLVTVFCAVTLIPTFASVAANEPEFSRTANYPSVSFSHSELAEFVSGIHRFISGYLDSTDMKYVSEQLTVSDPAQGISVSGSPLDFPFAGCPAAVYEIDYTFSSAHTKISRVTLAFRDYERSLTVVGRDLVQVNALSAFISDAISNHTSIAGGWSFRYACGLILFLLGFAIPVLGYLLGLERLKWYLSALGTAIQVCIYFIPWERFFPGAASYAIDASFYVRHSALITLLSAIITSVGLVIPLWQVAKRPRSAGTVPTVPSVKPTADK